MATQLESFPNWSNEKQFVSFVTSNLSPQNLAFADEFFLIGLPILIYTMHLGEWIFGVYLCKLYMISTSITQFTSSIFLVIMSADRFDKQFYYFSFTATAKLNCCIMKFQIYCRMSSHRLHTLSYSAGFESCLDHRLVHISSPNAANYSLFHDCFKNGWKKVVQHSVAFGIQRHRWKLDRRGRWVHWIRWLNFYTVHFHLRICNSAESHTHILLSCFAEIANGRTEIKI